MTRARLQQIYEAQLPEALERRNEKGFDVAGFRLLLSVSRARGAVELQGADSRVWIWADLHLGDVDALTFFGRPFRSVDDMDHLLVERWQSVIGRNDLVVCLGDVTRGATSLPSLERLGGCPGGGSSSSAITTGRPRASTSSAGRCTRTATRPCC